MRPILQIPNKNKTSIYVASLIAERMNFITEEIGLSDFDNINTLIENKDAALLIIGLNSDKEIQNYLNKCRELRIPYIFVKNEIPNNFNIENILLPITNLEEEREKGPFSSSFARHFNCPITIYQPKDYGSKAATNIEAIKVLFDSFSLKYIIKKGDKDSNDIELEAGLLNKNNQNTILMISASRDYGLDDIIFGPKERKILIETSNPTMLINPRGDLYALCD